MCSPRPLIFTFNVQMFWSESASCDTRHAVTLIGDADGVLDVNSTLALWFEFDSTVSGASVHVCYKFRGKNVKSSTRSLLQKKNVSRTHFDCFGALVKQSTICQLFSICRADERFKAYKEFKIDIRMIRTVAVDIGSPAKAVPGMAKTFSFTGDGTATEV